MGKRTRRRSREWRAMQEAERQAWAYQPPYDVQLASLIDDAESLGYTVIFQRFVEDAETPGVVLGRMRGVCIASSKRIKVATNDATMQELREVLAHEIRHARGAEHAGDCPELGLACGGRVGAFG